MKWTGERLVTHVNEYYTYEHLHRYYLAMDFVKAKKVLDVASGEGYGAALMAKSAGQVTGVDIDPEAIAHANRKYANDQLRFETGDIYSLPLNNDEFDVITSFETIEHVGDHQKAMKELKRVLRPGGMLIISTPDHKSTHHHASNGQNPYHLKELDADGFVSLLSEYFEHFMILNQKTINASMIVSAGNDADKLKEYSGDFEQYTEMHPGTNAQYMIGICSDATLPTKPSDSLLTYHSTRKSIMEKLIFRIINLFK